MKNYNLTLSWSVFKNNELEKSDRMLVEAAKKQPMEATHPIRNSIRRTLLLDDDGSNGEQPGKYAYLQDCAPKRIPFCHKAQLSGKSLSPLR